MRPAHIWCNRVNPFWPQLHDGDACSMCQRLYSHYPWKLGDDERALAKEHFPDAVVVGDPDAN